MLKIYCGPMFSRKTYHLLNDLNELEDLGKTIKLIKPIIDTRTDKPIVTSRDGLERECTVIDDKNDDLLESVITTFSNYDVIGIDEAQFFSIDFLKILVNNMNKKGKFVIASGLDMDRFSEPFGSVPYLISVADEVVKLKANCSDCKVEGIASTEYMDSDDSSLIVIGDQEYLALCIGCRLKRIKDIILSDSLKNLFEKGFLDSVIYDNEVCDIVTFGNTNIICTKNGKLRSSIPIDNVNFYKEGLIFDINKNFK